MSAPLVVNTKDGVCWTRRHITSGGIALYAPESVCSCPTFVMATLPELAEHGIVGSADVLPVPVGTPVTAPVPRTERSYWADIAAALNAAVAAGLPVGIDLDGTLTDRNTWSVVWLSTEQRWVVAGWEDDDAERPVSVGEWYRRVREPDVRVHVTEIWRNGDADELSVAFDIHGRDWAGRPLTTHSALRMSLFRELYRITAEAGDAR